MTNLSDHVRDLWVEVELRYLDQIEALCPPGQYLTPEYWQAVAPVHTAYIACIEALQQLLVLTTGWDMADVVPNAASRKKGERKCPTSAR